MTMTLDADKFIEDRTGRYAKPYAEALNRMMVAAVRENRSAFESASAQLDRVMRETSGIAAIVGASTVLRDAAGGVVEEVNSRSKQRVGFARRGTFTAEPELLTFVATPTQSILPRVTFTEALEDLVRRTPVTLKDAATRTAANISALYGPGQGNIAFVKAAEEAVTEKAKSIITKAFEDGIGENEAGRRIKMGVEEARKLSASWSESYARLTFRNNVNEAVMEGQLQQWRDPDIAVVIPAVRFDTAGDVDVRGNHRPADGKIFRADSMEWRHMRTPIGHNCRCKWNSVTLPMLRRMGRISEDGKIREDSVPSGAHPDAGFR